MFGVTEYHQQVCSGEHPNCIRSKCPDFKSLDWLGLYTVCQQQRVQWGCGQISKPNGSETSERPQGQTGFIVMHSITTGAVSPIRDSLSVLSVMTATGLYPPSL